MAVTRDTRGADAARTSSGVASVATSAIPSPSGTAVLIGSVLRNHHGFAARLRRLFEDRRKYSVFISTDNASLACLHPRHPLSVPFNRDLMGRSWTAVAEADGRDVTLLDLSSRFCSVHVLQQAV